MLWTVLLVIRPKLKCGQTIPLHSRFMGIITNSMVYICIAYGSSREKKQTTKYTDERPKNSHPEFLLSNNLAFRHTI